MPKETVEDVKRILAEGNALRYSRVDKVGVFVGNLPYSYAEKEIEELLAEYGVINVSLVRDADQQSKGFAFVDVSTAINGFLDTVTAVASIVMQISSKEDAERLLSEMANYYTEPGRKLTVRMVRVAQHCTRSSTICFLLVRLLVLSHSFIESKLLRCTSCLVSEYIGANQRALQTAAESTGPQQRKR
jgi:hypothetical protein